MSDIKHAYINALLANASYVKFLNDDGTPLDSNSIRNNLTADLTQPQATYLLANFDILTQTLSPTGGFDATVWKGKAGTEFAGQVFVSMRGTAGSQDIFDDIELAGRGVTYNQIRDMANWWLKATAKAGETVKQIRVDSFETPSLTGNGTTTSYTFAADTAVKATGELHGQANAIQGVNGHSLGGYLATAFTRLFGANVSEVSTYNSAGFSDLAGENIKTEFDKLVSLLGIGALGTGSFESAGAKQTNYRAGNGVNVTTNNWGEMPYWALGFNQYGEKVALDQEDTLGFNPIANHSMFKLTDMLALGAMLEKLDPRLSIARLNDLVKAGSDDMKASYEGVLDSVRRLIGLIGGPKTDPTQVGDVGGNADSRKDFHTKLIDLQNNTTFKALAGKLSLMASAASARDACMPSGRFEGAHKVHELRNSCQRTRKKKITFSGQRICQTALSDEYQFSGQQTHREATC